MKKTRIISMLIVLVLTFSFLFALSMTAFAAEEETEPVDVVAAEGADETLAEETPAENGKNVKAIAAAAIVGAVATAGAVAMAMSIRKSTEGMARQPEAADKINSAMMLGLVFIETAIIYALIVAILIIFVL